MTKINKSNFMIYKKKKKKYVSIKKHVWKKQFPETVHHYYASNRTFPLLFTIGKLNCEADLINF